MIENKREEKVNTGWKSGGEAEKLPVSAELRVCRELRLLQRAFFWNPFLESLFREPFSDSLFFEGRLWDWKGLYFERYIPVGFCCRLVQDAVEEAVTDDPETASVGVSSLEEEELVATRFEVVTLKSL